MKSCHDGLRLLFLNGYESDLSNEVLYALVGQEAAKISDFKVGGGKKLPTRRDSTLMRPGLADLADFLSTFNFDL